MRRLPQISFLITASLLVAATPSNGAVKAGAACKQVGKIATKSGTEYRCVKKGKKLVWKKITKAIDVPATPIVTPTPTPTTSPSSSPSPTQEPTPTPTPTPSLTPTPTPTPTPTQSAKPLTFAETLWSRGSNGRFPIEDKSFDVPTEIPTSWQDVYEKRYGIPYQAWSAISKNVASNPSKVGNVEILTGPNTVPNFADIKLPMELVSRAFPTAQNVKNLKVFVFNFKDSKWADETFKKTYINETTAFKNRHANAVTEICPASREVCFAQAFIDSNSNGVIMQGMTDIGSREQLNQTFSEYARAYRGVNIAHEYLHTVQRVILGDRWYQRIYTPPTWFIEGSAVFVEGSVLHHQSFDGFMRFRAVDSKLLYSDCPYEFCVKVDFERVLDYLSMSHYEKNWDNFPYAMKYEMSARTIEILVALKGPGSIIGFIEYMATGKTFEEAFQHIYGISYETAKPIIARIVADQFANGR